MSIVLPLKKFFCLIFIFCLSFILMSGCTKIFRKRPTSRVTSPQTSAPAGPSVPSIPTAPPQPPTTMPPPSSQPSPPAKPEALPQPEVKKPVLTSDSAAARLLSQAWENLKNGNLDLAEMRFEKVLRISPSSGSAYYGLAHISYTRGQYLRCIEFLQSAELYSFNDSSLLLEVYMLEGDSYLKMGKRGDAINSYKNGLGIDPENQALLDKLRKVRP